MKYMLFQLQTDRLGNRHFNDGFLFSHLEAPWSPRIPGCSSSSLSPGCSESGGPPSPIGPFRHRWSGSAPAAPGSSPPAGSWIWPFPCGSSVILRPCLTLLAGGHWPLPTVVQQRRQHKDECRSCLSSSGAVHASLRDTWFCSWIILSFEACEFWLIFLISSSCSFKVDTRKQIAKTSHYFGTSSTPWHD